MRAIRARIELRDKIEREPSASEVQAYMHHQFTDQVSYKEVTAAFRSGKEVRQTFGFLQDYSKDYREYPEIGPGWS
jgi:hypothetical protein